MVSKREVSFEIEDDDSKELKNEKTMAIRKLVMSVLEAIKKWTVFAK